MKNKKKRAKEYENIIINEEENWINRLWN